MEWNGGKERAEAIPDDLHADADEEERRKADDDEHGRVAERLRQAVSKAVAKIDAEGDQQDGEDRGENDQDMDAVAVGRVCTESDRDGDGARANGEREG